MMCGRNAFRRPHLVAASVLGLSALAGAAEAHHSFAVFFSGEKEVVSITGTVRAFRFTNPHGSIEMVVAAKGKPDAVWNVETNSPSYLVRKGWSRDSVKPGDTVTIQGWPARDGSNWMRLRNALHADGSPIGVAGPLMSEAPPAR